MDTVGVRISGEGVGGVDISRLSQITALTGGDYGAKAELDRLQTRRNELLQKLQDTTQDEKPGSAATTVKDIAKDLKEVDRRVLETQLEDQTRKLEAEGQKNLQEIAKKQRQREEVTKKTTGEPAAVFSGSLTKLLNADNRAGSLSTLREVDVVSPGKKSTVTKNHDNTAAKSPVGPLSLAAVYDSRTAYEERRWLRRVEHETNMISRDVSESVEMGIAEASAARRARQEKMRQEERQRLGLEKKKGFQPPGVNVQV